MKIKKTLKIATLVAASTALVKIILDDKKKQALQEEDN